MKGPPACFFLLSNNQYAGRYGGVVAFTGGLIGDKIYTENYQVDFANTPVLIATGDPDPNVPVERVYASAHILTKMMQPLQKKYMPVWGIPLARRKLKKQMN